MSYEKQDLILFLESYKNSIDLNMALSKQVQDIIIKIVVLDQNLELILKFQEKIMRKDPALVSSLEKIKDTSIQYKDTILSLLSMNNKESIKRVGKIKLMIWIGYVGSASIILTLVGLLTKR